MRSETGAAEVLEHIHGLESRRRLLDNQITARVSAARAKGASWADIGDALGISKQAAQKRYDRRLPGM